MSVCVYLTISMLIIATENDRYKNVYWLQDVFKILVHNSSSKFPLLHDIKVKV